jgi:hypothetical protein
VLWYSGAEAQSGSAPEQLIICEHGRLKKQSYRSGEQQFICEHNETEVSSKGLETAVSNVISLDRRLV